MIFFAVQFVGNHKRDVLVVEIGPEFRYIRREIRADPFEDVHAIEAVEALRRIGRQLERKRQLFLRLLFGSGARKIGEAVKPKLPSLEKSKPPVISGFGVDVGLPGKAVSVGTAKSSSRLGHSHTLSPP